MTITLYPEEPPAGPWRVERIVHVFGRFADRAKMAIGRPLVVAVDRGWPGFTWRTGGLRLQGVPLTS